MINDRSQGRVATHLNSRIFTNLSLGLPVKKGIKSVNIGQNGIEEEGGLHFDDREQR